MNKPFVTAGSSNKILKNSSSGNIGAEDAFDDLIKGVNAALETYSNVHRGSGHNSMVSTHLYEHAREIVLEYLGLPGDKYVVIFCTPARVAVLTSQLKPGSFRSLSSNDIGLPLGLRALAVSKKALPKGAPFQTGGGTTRLVSAGWVIWAAPPDKFEAGTPSIINVVTFAKALKLIKRYGNEVFRQTSAAKLTADEILYHDDLKEQSGHKLLDELRQTLIGRDIIVPTLEGVRPFINLDNAASTPTFIQVWKTTWQTWVQPLQVQKEIINEVKTICSDFLGAPGPDYDVIFASNTTEAINLASESLSNGIEREIEPVILSTLIEHTSNDLPWRSVPNSSLIRLNVDAEGFIDMYGLDKLLCEYNKEFRYGQKRIRLMAVSGASNVLGVFNNLEEISRIVHRYGAHLLVDGAQMVAHRRVMIEKCGIDYFAFSAHKMYAPFGTGVLVIRKGLLNLSPSRLELIRSSGEENAGGIAALGKALLLLQRIGMDTIREEEQVLTRYALQSLSQIPGLRIYGIRDPDSPCIARKGGVIVFGMKGIMADAVAKKLAEQGGIGVRYGCHCAHILIKHLAGVPHLLEPFQGLLALLFPGLKFPGLVRVSLGIENTEHDIDAFIRVLSKITSQSGNTVKKLIRRQLEDFVAASTQRVYN